MKNFHFSNDLKNDKKNFKSFQCQQYSENFSTEEKLLHHTLVHLEDEQNQPLACDICQKRFLNNSALLISKFIGLQKKI